MDMRRFRSTLMCCQLALACSQAGCQPAGTTISDDHLADGKIAIVCTTGMVADIVSHVAGERAAVVALMGEGVDPHLYVPTGSDIRRLQGADVVFYSGLLLEGQMQSTFELMSGKGRPVFAVTADIPKSQLRTPAEFEGHPDPHVWNDVALWSLTVDTVANRLGEFDPEHAAEYLASANVFQAELEGLDRYAREVIASIPESQRYLVTAHDAFEYFSRSYGVPVESVQGITTESEPGVDDIVRLVDMLVTNKVPAIFVESSVNSANIQSVIEGAKSRGWDVRKGGTLFSDAMGPEGTYEGTYIGMIDHNATTIARALGGQAPEKGMQGKLNRTGQE
ncbi:MAG: zinc ABC transporter substrate-binding protein [Planctomycetaceae bacterium]|nr:zinc ABC transporter substrate-binding protein [Planctomycetaceae bacterium]